MLGNVMKNFGSLTTMRIISRLFQFALKTYLIRTQLDEQILAHLLNLDLIINTALHIVKSCLKPSYQKVENNENIVKSSMNIMNLGIVITILSSIIIAFIQYYQYINSKHHLIFFVETIVLYALSAVFQAVAEKYMVEWIVKYKYFEIGVIQVVCIIPKTIIIFIAAYYNLFSSYGILIFGVGTVVYSFMFMTVFYFKAENKAIFPQAITHKGQLLYIDPKSKQSLKQFSITSFFKFILHQFEKIVLVIMDISHVSSIYSLISNLGSIVVRYLFAPLNEIIFNYFSRGSDHESLDALITFLKSVTNFSILAVSFGYNYSRPLLLMLYGDKWITEESVLAMRTYCVLVVFLGYNGVIEAFFFSKAKNSMNRYNFLTIFTTSIYLALTVGFLKYGMGTPGLFMGNIINMALRIMLCWNLQLKSYLPLGQFLLKIRPSLFYMITSLLIFLFSHSEIGLAQSFTTNHVLNILIGGILLLVNFLPIIFENKQMIFRLISERLLKRKSESKRQ